MTTYEEHGGTTDPDAIWSDKTLNERSTETHGNCLITATVLSSDTSIKLNYKDDSKTFDPCLPPFAYNAMGGYWHCDIDLSVCL